MRHLSHISTATTLRNLVLTVALLIGSLLPAATLRAQNLPGVQNERLSYDIIYQLGFLWKRAATATLQLTVRPNSYHSVLTARTLPFADNIFRVRDTLVADMHRNRALTPIYYAKLADEDNTYRKDEVHYLYNGTATTGQIRLYRPKRNVVEDYTLTEPGFVYDMLSVFYVIRAFDFRTMRMNQLYNFRGRASNTSTSNTWDRRFSNRTKRSTTPSRCGFTSTTPRARRPATTSRPGSVPTPDAFRSKWRASWLWGR